MSTSQYPARGIYRAMQTDKFKLLHILSKFKDGPVREGDIFGEIARVFDEPEPRASVAFLNPSAVEASRRLRNAPSSVLGPAIAAIRLPSDRMWLEFRDGGVLHALAVRARPDGTILVRSIEQGPDDDTLRGQLWDVSVHPADYSPPVDWRTDPETLVPDPEAEQHWVAWLITKISVIEAMDMGGTRTQDEPVRFLADEGLPNLALLAVACSPLDDGWFHLSARESREPGAQPAIQAGRHRVNRRSAEREATSLEASGARGSQGPTIPSVPRTRW
jgi:hypothetical protein